MSDHTGSSRFRVLFEAAVQQYEKQTEITLATHPLAEQLQNCDSVDSVIAVLQEQARAFSEFRESDRIIKSLEGVVSVLSTISAVADLSDSIGLVRQKAPIGCPMF
jgi:Lon protease-like protein